MKTAISGLTAHSENTASQDYFLIYELTEHILRSVSR